MKRTTILTLITEYLKHLLRPRHKFITVPNDTIAVEQEGVILVQQRCVFVLGSQMCRRRRRRLGSDSLTRHVSSTVIQDVRLGLVVQV